MKTIITHPGRAHRDEFLAASLILQHLEDEARILRRDPTAEEINDPETWVVDVGKVHDPSRRCFDHHQEHGGAQSALSQVAEHLGVDLSIYRWYETTVMIDDRGPKKVAKSLDISLETMGCLISPIEKGLLVKFEQSDRIAPDAVLYELMKFIGENLVEYAQRVQDEIRVLQEADLLEVGGLYGIDGRALPEAPEPKAMALVKEQEEKETGKTISFSVSRDCRGDGLALFRYEEDELNFHRLKGCQEILFAHPAGFLATTKEYNAPWRELVKKSKRR